MSEKKYVISFGAGEISFPKKAIKKIVSGQASEDEIRVLAVILEYPEKAYVKEIAKEVSLEESDVKNAIAFWRGVGIINIEKVSAENKSQTEKVFAEKSSAENLSSEKAGADKAETETDEKEEYTDKKRRALLREEMPKYTGIEISALLDKDGGRLRDMIDECQQIIGHIFNPNETEVMVGLCDWLGVSPEFVITLSAYYTQKKPGCKVSYIQRAAFDLVNSGVDSSEALDAYLKDMELYDGLSGKLRSWLGIGARAYTKKENATINHWIKDLNYGEDIVHYAYEITVDSKGSFSFDYANKILENWFSGGVKTVDEAKEKVTDFRKENEAKSKSKGSFDTEELFDLALKRSYGKMLGETKKS